MSDDHRAASGLAEDGFRHVDDTLVHHGFIWNLVTGTFESPDGSTFTRDIVRSPGSVGVLPIVENELGTLVVLVTQYRPPLDRAILEIPAGMRDIPGEDPEDTGRRELVEEAGLQAGGMELLAVMTPSPGMTDSTCHIYCATECVAVSVDRQGPEEDRMGIVEITMDEALALVDDGTIYDAKTVIALLAADRRRSRSA